MKRGADVNAEDKYDNRPLLVASQGGHLEVVKALLDKGADVNLATFGNTPLLFAAERGHVQVVKELLKRGANVNAKKYDWTALLAASQGNHIETVKALLNHGANVDAKDKDGRTSLYVAFYSGHLEVAKALLDKNADVNAPDKRNRFTPLRLAFSKEASQLIIQHLVERSKDKPDYLTGEYSIRWDKYKEKLLTEPNSNLSTTNVAVGQQRENSVNNL